MPHDMIMKLLFSAGCLLFACSLLQAQVFMRGFDNAAVDKEFFAPLGLKYESDFICAFGYGEDETLYKRNPRLTFEDACKVL